MRVVGYVRELLVLQELRGLSRLPCDRTRWLVQLKVRGRIRQMMTPFYPRNLFRGSLP